MGQSKPVNSKAPQPKDCESSAKCGCARPVYNQYRLNQPHDRESRSVGLS